MVKWTNLIENRTMGNVLALGISPHRVHTLRGFAKLVKTEKDSLLYFFSLKKWQFSAESFLHRLSSATFSGPFQKHCETRWTIRTSLMFRYNESWVKIVQQQNTIWAFWMLKFQFWVAVGTALGMECQNICLSLLQLYCKRRKKIPVLFCSDFILWSRSLERKV